MDVKARDLGLRFNPSANVHVLPSEPGHVGADNVGVLIAEEPYRKEEIALIVDIGTNAEILLGDKDWMFSSSPTGPAFEGAQIAFGIHAAPGAIERVRIDPISKEARFKVIGEESGQTSGPSTGMIRTKINLIICPPVSVAQASLKRSLSYFWPGFCCQMVGLTPTIRVSVFTGRVRGGLRVGY